MPRILFVTDLHLETLDHEAWSPSGLPDFDILACGGDTVEREPEACVAVVARLAAGRPAVMVLGNHDVWGIPLREAARRAGAADPAVTVLDGRSVVVGGVRFAGGTLWDDPDHWPPGIPRVGATEATESGEPVTVDGIDGPRRATLGDLGGEHFRTLGVIAGSGADVVLTHYPPSDADLGKVPGSVVWLHGHVHTFRVERAGRHHLVRMPARHDIDLVGCVVDVGGRGKPPVVMPAVALRTAPATA